ncbi:MAG TPA: DUF192 domain-containing protein [Limnobacter sp.]|nr:DUF192 domain-containing protein [Limnobacter sp.]
MKHLDQMTQHTFANTNQFRLTDLLLVGALVTIAWIAPAKSLWAEDAHPTAPTHTIALKVGAAAVSAEVADTPLARQRGLMHRAHLEENHGMLFVFDRPEIQCMWMKNTLIDLDVAFADRKGKIINVATMKAGTSHVHCSAEPALLALEMNAGWFAKRAAGPGTPIELPGGMTSKPHSN